MLQSVQTIHQAQELLSLSTETLLALNCVPSSTPEAAIAP